MINAFEYFKNHPKFKKLIGDDFLFVEYKCPLDIDQYQLWIENQLHYLLNLNKRQPISFNIALKHIN